MNILIVEDDKAVARSLRKILQKIESINVVQEAHTFQEGFAMAIMDIFDVILIDIHLGDHEPSGIDLCMNIRKRNDEIPIIMVTALHSMGYLQKAFDAGANDYITKPFHFEELKIRTQRWMKLSHKIRIHPFIEYQDIRYDHQKNSFFYKKYPMDLTKKEKNLLLIFLTHSGKVLPVGYLQEKLWGDYEENQHRNIRSNIQNLREILTTETDNTYTIKNIRGEGYILANTPQ